MYLASHFVPFYTPIQTRFLSGGADGRSAVRRSHSARRRASEPGRVGDGEAVGGTRFHRPARTGARPGARVEAHAGHDHVDVLGVRVDGDPLARAAVAPAGEVA